MCGGVRLELRRRRSLSIHDDGRGFLLVGVGVLHHPVLPDEPLATNLATEGFLPSVQAHVSPQVRLVVELLGTNLALVRLVTSVLGQVLLQIGI